ncbi:MAG: ABC transporter permease subunit [Christensenellaceae bacterium]
MILTVSIFENMGWSSIMFLGRLPPGPELFEAAELDGANRWQQVRRISVPGIMPTVSIVLILSIGNIFKDDFEQIYGLVGENDILAETTNVISTWVYKLANSGSASSYALGTAASLIQSLVSLILVVTANAVSRRLGQDGLWRTYAHKKQR